MCEAVRYSDRVKCGRCLLEWDTNDPHPPACKKPDTEKFADEITSIRNQLWQLTDDMPMTRNQARSMEVVKDRLWRVQELLRGIK